MKYRNLIILIVSLLMIVFLGWFFLRDGDTPIIESIKNGLPFGSGEGVNLPIANGDDAVGAFISDESGAPTTDLFPISNTPVAGFVALTRDKETIVRYVDKATGHIYDTRLSTLEKMKITNQTLPKIYEAHFRSDGNAVLLRSLNENESGKNISLALTPPKTTSTSSPQLYSVSATTLRGDIDSVAVGVGNTLFYTLKDSSSIVSSTFDNTSLKTIFTSAFNNWRLSRTGNNLVIYTKASASAPGYAYNLNVGNGVISKILGPQSGLTVTPNSTGNVILYSYFENNTTRLFVRNVSSNTDFEILPTTLSEKCTWSSKQNAILFCATPTGGVNGTEPDNWYKGVTHFSDYIWRFDTAAEIAQLIIEPKVEFDVDLDVYEPKLSPDENYLIFINKIDLSLWALKLQ